MLSKIFSLKEKSGRQAVSCSSPETQNRHYRLNGFLPLYRFCRHFYYIAKREYDLTGSGEGGLVV